MAPSEMDTELPRAQVKRLVKMALQQQSNSDKDFTVSKDALLALSESTKIFIHFLTATANDICKGSKRQTINAKDVFEALSELDFEELEEPLREAMEVFKKSKTAKTPASRKPKVNAADRADNDHETPGSAGGDEGAGHEDADEHQEDEAEEGEEGHYEDGGEEHEAEEEEGGEEYEEEGEEQYQHEGEIEYEGEDGDAEDDEEDRSKRMRTE